MSGGKETTELSLGRETALAVGAKFLLAATGFVGIIIFARVLNADGLGKYYFLLAIAKLAVQFPGGINTAVKKRVSEVNVDAEEFFGLGLITVAGFTGLSGFIAVVGYPLFQDRIGPFAFAAGLVGIVGSLALFTLVNRLYAGIGHPGASFWTDTIRSVLTLGAQVAFLVLGFHVLGLMAGLVVATTATAVLVVLLAKVTPHRPSRTTLSRTWTFARWSIPNSLTQNLYMRLDVLILGILISDAAVGYYEPALRLTIPAAFIATSIGDSLTVKASGLDSLGHDVASDLRNALSYTCLFAIPIMFGAFAMPETLMVVIFGAEYRPGWVALVGLGIFQIFNTYRLPFDNVVDGMNRPDLRFRVSLFTLLINVPLAIILGLEFGLLGVVVATTVAEAGRVAAYLVISYRLFDEVMVPRPIFEQLGAGIVMFIVVFAITNQITLGGAIPLVGVIALGAALYFSTLLGISPHFRLTLRNVLSDLFPT